MKKLFFSDDERRIFLDLRKLIAETMVFKGKSVVKNCISHIIFWMSLRKFNVFARVKNF